MVLGITGGIASGKSTVTKVFAELGAIAISADAIAYELMQPGMPLTRQILYAFGSEYASPDDPSALDRRKLGRLVFRDQEARARLESLTHPAIMNELTHCVSNAHADNSDALVTAEIPLLFEANLVAFCDKTLVVACSIDTQRARLKLRNPDLSDQEARDRIDSQMPLSEKIVLADFVISSEQSHEAMRADVRRLFDSLTAGRV